jgi:hypothetical protein
MEKREQGGESNSIFRIRNHEQQLCVSSDKEFEIIYQKYRQNISKTNQPSLQKYDWTPPTWIKECSEREKYAVNLTKDGFLVDGDVFYPPEDFCIEE